jgi:hypothetical protein
MRRKGSRSIALINATFEDFAEADSARRGALTLEEIDIYIKRNAK